MATAHRHTDTQTHKLTLTLEKKNHIYSDTSQLTRTTTHKHRAHRENIQSYIYNMMYYTITLNEIHLQNICVAYTHSDNKEMTRTKQKINYTSTNIENCTNDRFFIGATKVFAHFRWTGKRCKGKMVSFCMTSDANESNPLKINIDSFFFHHITFYSMDEF